MSRRSLLLFLFTTLTLPCLAQSLDVYVDIRSDDRQARLSTIYVVEARWDDPRSASGAVAEFDVPGADIMEVHPYSAGTTCVTTERPIRCALGDQQDPYGGFSVRASFPRAGSYTASARIISP